MSHTLSSLPSRRQAARHAGQVTTRELAQSSALGFALVAALFTMGFAAATLHAQSSHAGHQPAASTTASRTDPVPLLNTLGSWHHTISTSEPLAQQYFDQGLRLYYGFNHAESVRAFREAQRRDPKCVMCVWGEAMALGPNMNAPMDSSAEVQAIAATERAVTLVRATAGTARAVAREAAWVNAIAARYLNTAATTRAGRDSAYALTMATIADANPSDADALALAAESAMDLSPWNYWTRKGEFRPGTARFLAWLERGLKQSPSHPGVCHFYIHAVEAARPERAVACAERLAALMPGAGHIVHMPAHIYIRVGRWADAIAINKHAVHADEEYFDGPHTPDALFYSAAYQSHNHHFLTLAAVMAGASNLAIASSKKVTEIVTPELARMVPPLEPMLAIPVQTLVTFGKWNEVLRMPLPPSELRVALAHSWYARGIAFAATGRTSEARATIDSILSVVRGMPTGEPRTTLEIAARMVMGEVALTRGDAESAVLHFRAAARMEDGLSYMEPPTWYYPVRHSLGKALLAAKQPTEAERVYREDLKRFPENGWSLKGLALALTAQNRPSEAAIVEKRFARAWKQADVKIDASRY